MRNREINKYFKIDFLVPKSPWEVLELRTDNFKIYIFSYIQYSESLYSVLFYSFLPQKQRAMQQQQDSRMTSPIIM